MLVKRPVWYKLKAYKTGRHSKAWVKRKKEKEKRKKRELN
jgi:hypothetical protein